MGRTPGKRPLKRKVINRDDKGRLLPGSRLNPKGRTPVPYLIRHEIAHRTNDLNMVLDWLVTTLTTSASTDNIKFKCSELLFNYALGKPLQMVDVESKQINIHINQEDTGEGDTILIDDI